jgi:lysophospholipase L1-like esterase
MRNVKTSARAHRVLAAVLGTLLLVSGVAVPSLAAGSTQSRSAAPAPGRVYLALGDSLAASFQPNGDMRSGYAEQLHQLEQARTPALRLVKLGCPGERTDTIDRPRRPCPYPEGSQLDQAVAVLQSRDVAFVTLQIGSNDTARCFRFGAVRFDQACIDEALPKIASRLASIVEALRAADPDVPIVGSNYLDPLLVAWTIPGVDHDAVVAIADVWTAMNDTLEETYAALGVPVADTEGAFSATDFDTIVHVRGVGDVPINVARVCQWTYACSERFDHDFHPNTIGYAAMTRAFETALEAALVP